MLSLPVNTVLGNLYIETSFQFYDIPRLFTCSNRAGQQFLALSLFDDYESFSWLYLPISSDRISTLLANEMLLRNAFQEPEDGYLYSVKSNLNGDASVKHVFPEQIDEQDLPDQDVYLITTEKPHIGLGAIDANIAAEGSRRETFNLHLYPWDTKLPEIDVKDLGNVLTSFQYLADALGQYRKGEVTLKGAISADILEQTKFRATQIFEGSLASDVLQELINLLESRDNEDNISNKLHELKGRVASKYRLFLKEISKLNSSLKLDWGSPNKERGYKISLSKNEIHSAFHTVSKIDIDMSESISFKAELVGIDLQTKRYRVRNLDDNESYSGKILDESIEAVKHSEISAIYNITLKKIIETNSSSGSEYTKWILVGLENPN